MRKLPWEGREGRWSASAIFFGNYEYIISFCIASFAGRERKKGNLDGRHNSILYASNFKINRFYFHLQVMKDKS